MLASTIVLLAGLIQGAVARNNLTFELTLDPLSPLFRFNVSDSDPQWNTTFEDSPYPPSGDMVGRGAVYRSFNWSTYDPNATRSTPPLLDVQFAGTEVTLLGTATGAFNPNASANVIDDSVSFLGPKLQMTEVPRAEGELAHFRINNDTERKPTSFSFNLTTAAQMVQVRGARLSYTIPSDMQSFADVPVTSTPFVVNGNLNPSMDWTQRPGSWIVTNRTINTNGVDTTVLEAANEGTSTSQVTFRLPRGTAFFTVNGTVGPTSGQLAVKTSPPFLGQDQSKNYQQIYFECSAEYFAGTTLAAIPLDPDVDYDVNLEGSGGQVGLYGITLYSALDPSSNNTSGGIEQVSGGTSSNGTLIGGVVGGVIGGILLALLAGYICYWRPRARRRREEEAELSSFNAGFVSFGRDTPIGIVQETDAGAAPPQYDDLWGEQNQRVPSSDSLPSPPVSSVQQEKAALLSPSTKSASSPETPLGMKIPLVIGQAAGTGGLNHSRPVAGRHSQDRYSSLPDGAAEPVSPHPIPCSGAAEGSSPQASQGVARPLPQIPASLPKFS